LPFEQLRKDIEGRLKCYMDDWSDVCVAGGFLTAPTVYIFLASVLPALAFGQQMNTLTEGLLGIPHVLVVTCMAGVIQAFVGGQPLLIIGVAEPIVVMYGFMFDLVKEDVDIGKALFLPFCSWVCLWTGLFCMLLASAGATEGIRYFTLFAGELFGGLIAILFLQQACHGTYEEFHHTDQPSVNGLWAVLTLVGMPATTFAFMELRHSSLLNPTMRKIADYSPALMCIVWSALAFVVTNYYDNVPERVNPEQPWDVSTWDVVTKMFDVPVRGIFMATVPAFAIAVLFYFDHTVSSQLAQTGADVTVERPPAYAWDLFLLGIMSCIAGCLGMPPINGVIPQAPMHARALRGIVAEQKRKADKKREKKAKKLAAGQGSEGPVSVKRKVNEENLLEDVMTTLGLPQKAADVLVKSMDKQAMEAVLDCEIIIKDDLRESQYDASINQGGWLTKGKLAVMEQRGTNLIQALMVGVCALIAPALKQIPTCVLWGYFAFMALESLPGMQLVNRIILIITDYRKREQHLEGQPYANVEYWVIVKFTLLQLFLLLAIWILILFGGIVGIGFPILILLLLPFRSHVMPSLFGAENMRLLDKADYEDPAPEPEPEPEVELVENPQAEDRSCYSTAAPEQPAAERWC